MDHRVKPHLEISHLVHVSSPYRYPGTGVDRWPLRARLNLSRDCPSIIARATRTEFSTADGPPIHQRPSADFSLHFLFALSFLGMFNFV